MRLLLALIVVALAADGARAGSLDRPDHIDAIELEAGTSRALLLVLLEEDRINTRPAMRALVRKVNRYLDFVRSGQLTRAARTANAAHQPRIVVYGPREATSAEMQNLAGLRQAGRKAGVEVEVLPHRPGIRPRPVRITPSSAAVRMDPTLER